MILEKIPLSSGREQVFLRMSEPDAIYLINVLSSMLQKNHLTSRELRLDRFLGEIGVPVHVSVWSEFDYNRMLNS